jgi:peptidoglycan hydrolase CwlO-like protein
LAETKESLAEAKRALSAAESRGATSSTALDSALLQLRDTREMLAATEARATQAQAAAVAELRAQIVAAEARAQAQVEAIRQSVLAAQQKAQTPPPAGTPSSPTYPGPSGTGTTTPPATTAPGGGDWVKLGLQLGAAYLLLS